MAYQTMEERKRQDMRRKRKRTILVVLIVLLLILLGILFWFLQHSVITIAYGKVSLVSLIL